MIIAKEHIERNCEEPEIFNELLSLDNKNIVEIGCGKAALTRVIATGGEGRRLTAFEIDEIQHQENLKITDLPNVNFQHGAAEAMSLDNQIADVIFMFKSLHHVPLDSMGDAFSEIHRVLKSNGLVYISEPVFAGEFNEILRLFHNEEAVRLAAFNAEKEAIASGNFELIEQVFFNAPMHFEDFAAFENQVLGVTHTDFNLSLDTLDKVKQAFETHLGPDGAHFNMPIRVDLLRVIK